MFSRFSVSSETQKCIATFSCTHSSEIATRDLGHTLGKCLNNRADFECPGNCPCEVVKNKHQLCGCSVFIQKRIKRLWISKQDSKEKRTSPTHPANQGHPLSFSVISTELAGSMSQRSSFLGGDGRHCYSCPTGLSCICNIHTRTKNTNNKTRTSSHKREREKKKSSF